MTGKGETDYIKIEKDGSESSCSSSSDSEADSTDSEMDPGHQWFWGDEPELLEKLSMTHEVFRWLYPEPG